MNLKYDQKKQNKIKSKSIINCNDLSQEFNSNFKI